MIRALKDSKLKEDLWILPTLFLHQVIAIHCYEHSIFKQLLIIFLVSYR
jgi:hypothetical protein